ncbi:MAG: hypothetical protein Q4G14_01245 [Paracoccus sp. (in: a-proteobacteria)]|nr:hypothetical protein [Paracoccus sp. (in: a-proteobacteria)]
MPDQLADIPEDASDLLPSATAIYAKKGAALTTALVKPEERPQAVAALRMPIKKIVLTPGPERGKSTPRCMANCAGSSDGWGDRPLERPAK